MAKTFKRGNHVEWNSEAGRVRGVIVKKTTSDVRLKGSVRHRLERGTAIHHQEEKTDHAAIQRAAPEHREAPMKRRSKAKVGKAK